MEYIRKTYGVPAKRGAKVAYIIGEKLAKYGKITSAQNGKIRIRFTGESKTHPVPFHPVWNILYL